MEVNDVDNCGESKQEKDLRDISTTTVMDPLSRSPSETSEMARRFSSKQPLLILFFVPEKLTL